MFFSYIITVLLGADFFLRARSSSFITETIWESSQCGHALATYIVLIFLLCPDGQQYRRLPEGMALLPITLLNRELVSSGVQLGESASTRAEPRPSPYPRVQEELAQVPPAWDKSE